MGETEREENGVGDMHTVCDCSSLVRILVTPSR